MAAVFEKTKHIGSFGNVREDTLELNMVSVDGRAPRLHIGRWTPDGQHKHYSGFMTEAQAADLWGILEGMRLNGDK